MSSKETVSRDYYIFALVKHFFKYIITVVQLAPILHGQAQAIWKFNNIIYSSFNNPYSYITTDK